MASPVKVLSLGLVTAGTAIGGLWAVRFLAPTSIDTSPSGSLATQKMKDIGSESRGPESGMTRLGDSGPGPARAVTVAVII